MSTLQRVAPRTVAGEETELVPSVGEWYWVGGDDDDERWLGCVVEVGSNYVGLEGVRYTTRVHFDEILTELTPEPNADRYVAERVAEHQGEVRRLLAEARELTRRLAVSSVVTPADEETQALAVRGAGQSVDRYKGDLIRAKDETLPGIFKAVKEHNEAAAEWMGASLIPLKAEAEGLKPLITAIERRIFNVELYAGLTEEVVQVTDGPPAPAVSTPIYLMQRRAYMDEECLARYEVGGMEFKDIEAFDAWVGRAANRNRLLPHQRCVLAMRVRRFDKAREVHLGNFIQVFQEREADKITYLYLRNGEQLYRIRTAIEFGEKLFPDMGKVDETEALYFKRFVSRVDGFIRAAEYEQRVEQLAGKQRAWDALSPAEQNEKWYDRPRDWEIDHYEPYTPDSVYYDDARAYLEEEMARHNRLVLVLQGLLDRSPVFHPHPPWQLWGEDFDAALRLVYDDSRAITPGAAPDFEAYRSRLNSEITVGTVTVGQQDFWLRREAERENQRQERDYRVRNPSSYTWYAPYGDPGPGKLARVMRVRPRVKDATFEWHREGRSYRWDAPDRVKQTVRVPFEHLLNADAYTPGDFRQFFDDPRTRADYLKWAPLLLEAEEYKAGNRELGTVQE